MVPQLESIALTEFLTITPSAYLYQSPLPGAPTILIVKFAGVYRLGSSGSPDALLISAIRNAALHRYLPDGLIVDFSELDYQWGDDMSNLLPNSDEAIYFWRHTPIAIVVGPKCREAIRTITFGLDSEREIEAAIWAQSSLEAALNFIEPRAARRKQRG